MEKTTETGKKWTRRGVTMVFSVYFLYRNCPSFLLFLVSSCPVIACALFFLWIIMYSDRKTNRNQLQYSEDGELLSDSAVSSSSSSSSEEEHDSDRGDSEKEETARRLEWTADDEKNVRLVGSSELERNLRLEHLIEKRRSRNYQRSQTFINLIDSDLLTPTATDHPIVNSDYATCFASEKKTCFVESDDGSTEEEEEETENSRTEVVKKHWMNVRSRLSYGMKQMLASEEHGVESLSSDDSTDEEDEEEEEEEEEDDDDGDYVDEGQITEPVFETSKSLKEALHYLNKDSTRSYNSLASDMQVEISESGSPTKHHQHNHGGGEDANSMWVASSNLALVDQFESRTRELNEISEQDVFQKLSSTEEEEDMMAPPPPRPPPLGGGGGKSDHNQGHASFLGRSFMVNRSVMKDLDISNLNFPDESMIPCDSENVLHKRSKSTFL